MLIVCFLGWPFSTVWQAVQSFLEKINTFSPNFPRLLVVLWLGPKPHALFSADFDWSIDVIIIQLMFIHHIGVNMGVGSDITVMHNHIINYLIHWLYNFSIHSSKIFHKPLVWGCFVDVSSTGKSLTTVNFDWL